MKTPRDLERHFPWLFVLWRSPLPGWAFLFVLYLASIAHWGYIFRFAEFRAHDWPMVLDYQAVLRQALSHGQIPYMISEAKHGVPLFLGLPEVSLSPQCLLLPFMGDPAFNFFNICLLYSIGFIGILLIRRAHGLSNIVFLFLFLLFNFNGYLVSRVAVGHVMWYGYFFLPYFHLLVLRVMDKPDSTRWPVWMAVVLFAMELQGSFHLLIWCLMFLALVAFFDWRLIRPFTITAVLAMLLCFFRLLPAAVAWWGQGLPFMGGYPSLGTLLDALTAVRNCSYYVQSIMGWWEFDCFVGLSGFCLLIYFGVVRRWQTEPAESVRNSVGGELFPAYLFDLANALMLALTFDTVYAIIHELPLPLIASQRAPSRFIVVPLTMYMVLAAIQMQRFLSSMPRFQIKALVWIAVFFLAGELMSHSAVWRIRDAELSFRSDPRLIAARAAIAPPDWNAPRFGVYVFSVWFSAVISLVTGIALIVSRTRKRNRI